MNYSKINKKELKSEAKALLEEGSSKQEAYEKLNEKYNANLVVAEVIKSLPSKKRYKKFGVFHLLLMFGILAFGIYKIQLNENYALIFWYGIFIYFILFQRVNLYYWISIYQGFVLLPMLITVFRQGIHNHPTMLAYLLLPELILLLLPIWLMRKTIPKPIEKKVVYQNEEGNSKAKIIYNFLD